MKAMNNDDNTSNSCSSNWLGFKMDIPSSSSSTASAIPTSLFSYASYSTEDGGIMHSPLPVMPLKSDGSLFIMEALTRSHYESNHRSEALALSVDSMIYCSSEHQNQRQQQHHCYPFHSSRSISHEDQTQGLPLNIPEADINGMRNWVSRNTYQSNNSVSAMAYGELQSLSLSMSPGSQSSCVTASQHPQISPTVTQSCAVMETKKTGSDKLDYKQIVHRKSIDTFGQRTSQFRGVTRHRWTGRYEAHLWDNSCKKEGQSRKGRQVYLGGYDMEEKAARAYDLAALKYWGPSTHINFSVENYQKELEEMKNKSRQEYVAHLRRKSSGFSRGASIYRGVTRHHQHGRWQARIGRVAGNKDLYLGTFSTQEEAAEAYDVAAIKFRGLNAVTNFDITRYDVERIMASNTLLAGEVARRNKDTESTVTANASTNNNGVGNNQSEADWKMALHQSPQPHKQNQKGDFDSDKSHIFSLAPDNVVGSEVGKVGSHPMSNASSLVTSLSSSREGSPERTSVPMMFATTTSKLLTSNDNVNVSSCWIPTPLLRPYSAMSMPQMPVFTAWPDA